jgi:hypothetical protein
MAAFRGQHCRPICRLVASRFEASFATEIALVTRRAAELKVRVSEEIARVLLCTLQRNMANMPSRRSSVCASVHGALRTPSAKSSKFRYFFMVRQPLVGQDLLIIEDS